MSGQKKYLKTFKYSTLGTRDDNIQQTDEQLTYTDGIGHGEHAGITGFAQFVIEDFLRSFPDESPSDGEREF